MTHQTDTEVLIVGAGPTGLTMACLLAQYGVKFRIIDSKDGITTRSKALGVQARTLELFEQLDLADRAVEMGHPTTGVDFVVNGTLRASVDLSTFGRGQTKYPYVLILEQSKTEGLLLEKLQSYGGSVEWNCELLELHQNQEQAVACIRNPQGHIQNVTARYVVGADGARSPVRHQLGISFDGGTYENRFMLADMAMEWQNSREHLTLCLSSKGFVGFFPMVGTNRYRAIGILPDSVPENADAQFSELAPKIQEQAQVPMKLSDPLWVSTYKLHHRFANVFQVGRCFIAGDAAHIHSPAGAQGMNTGIQDSFNLAWKLKMVLSGSASPKLLETYHLERFPFARRLIKTTDRGFSFATTKNFFVKHIRLYLLPFVIKNLVRIPRFRDFVFRTISQIGIQYRQNGLNYQREQINGFCHAGDRFSLEKLGDEKDFDLCHDGFFHAFIIGSPDLQDRATTLLKSYLGDMVKIHTLAVRGEVERVLNHFGIHKDGVILVRPDQYTSYLSQGIDLENLEHYLQRFFIKNEMSLLKPRFDGNQAIL